MRYFQVDGIKYAHTGFQIDNASAVAFRFFISRDDGDEFDIPVLFSIQVLRLTGVAFSLGIPFLQESDRPKFLRYGFYRLKGQLEESNLNNWTAIVVDHTEVNSVKQDWPKQCNLLISKGEDLFCSVDIGSPVRTSLELCGRCGLPEPVFRCDNLRVQGSSSPADRGIKRLIIPLCICCGGHKLPNDLGECTRHVGRTCFVPFRFYLLPSKYPSEFAAPP